MFGRIGEWLPVDAPWKSIASAGLVVHDMYHHHPSDTGTFAQEVAALGAEWYIDIRPLNASRHAYQRDLDRFERNLVDSVLNAIDSSEPAPFLLPEKKAPALSAMEMQYFEAMADKVVKLLSTSNDPRAVVTKECKARLVDNLLWGYAQACIRFPDQQAVRLGRQTLTDTLDRLDLSEVPYEHVVTLTLSGYDCTVDFDDADAPLLSTLDSMEAVWMPWHSCDPGFPAQELTLHGSVHDYVAHVDQHFLMQAEDLADCEKRIPEGESNVLRKAYVTSPDLKETLAAGRCVTLPLATLSSAAQTPRGFLIL